MKILTKLQLIIHIIKTHTYFGYFVIFCLFIIKFSIFSPTKYIILNISTCIGGTKLSGYQ